METRSGQLSGGLRASAAYLLTGSLAEVNAAIPGYPVFAAQALRYTLATTVLAGKRDSGKRDSGKRDSGRRKIRRRRRSSAGRGRGHRVLSTHRADGGTARRGAAA